MATSTAREPAQEIERGLALFYRSRFDDALAHFEQLRHRQPDNALAAFCTGLVYGSTNKPIEQQRWFERSLAMDPSHRFGALCRALTHCAQRLFDVALSELDAFLALESNFALALSYKGYCLNQQRLFIAAADSLQRAVAMVPDYAWAHSNLAISMYSQAHYQQALVHFERVRELTPEDASAWSNAAIALRSVLQYERSLSYLDQAIRLDAYNEQRYLAKYRTMFIDDQAHRMLDCFDFMIDQQPQAVLQVMDVLERIKQTAVNAAEQRLLTVIIHRARARCLMSIGNYRAAINDLNVLKKLSYTSETQRMIDHCSVAPAQLVRASAVIARAMLHHRYKPGGEGFEQARDNFHRLIASMTIHDA